MQKHNPFITMRVCTLLMLWSQFKVATPLQWCCNVTSLLLKRKKFTFDSPMCSINKPALKIFFVLYDKNSIWFINELEADRSNPGNVSLHELSSPFITHTWLTFLNWCGLAKWSVNSPRWWDNPDSLFKFLFIEDFTNFWSQLKDQRDFWFGLEVKQLLSNNRSLRFETV